MSFSLTKNKDLHKNKFYWKKQNKNIPRFTKIEIYINTWFFLFCGEGEGIYNN